MLRSLLNQPRRVDEGLILQANQSILAYCKYLRKLNSEKKLASKYYRLELWATGFLDSLNELEQSRYCSMEIAKKVIHKSTEDMELLELENYQLHVYFYKNAFIRVFSILDKLGHFLNDLLDLETEKVKEKFSYFTVLRHMYKSQRHPLLEKKLYDLKAMYEEPMLILRKKRNMEIHFLNVEMLDDLNNMARAFSEGAIIEDLNMNTANLEKGYEMVCLSLTAVFTYALQTDIP